MKVVGLLFVAFIACASAAVPAPLEMKNDVLDVESHAGRLVVDAIIASAIQQISQSIRDAGLDPFLLERVDVAYSLPVPSILNGAASVESVRATGISNILINRLSFNLLTTRLNLDISLPHISLAIDDAWFDLTLLGHKFGGRTSSRLDIVNVGVRGEVRLNLGIISGVTVRSIDLNFYLGGLQYNGFANLMGYDLTPFIDHVVHHEVPATLQRLESDINELIEIIVTQVINDL